MAGQNGGAREGAGRKPTGRRKVNFYITEHEEEVLREGLAKIRKQEVAREKAKEQAVMIKDADTQPLMRMACGRVQAWGEGAGEKPVAGKQAWCVWCQKMEKIERVL